MAERTHAIPVGKRTMRRTNIVDIRDLGRATLAAAGLLLTATAPAWAGSTELVSDSGERPTISADGRYVAFVFPGAADRVGAVFVRDRQTRTTERVSIATDGTQANAGPGDGSPAISATGRYVAFFSGATNLGPEATKGGVFVRDRQAGTTVLASISSTGEPAASGNSTGSPAISADGRYVAFEASDARGPGDTNDRDIFVRDLQAGTTEQVNVSSRGAQANGSRNYLPSISSNGRYVAFVSDASNLVPGDTNGQWDVFVRDRQTRTT